MDIIARITIGPSDHERHAVDYGVETRRSGYLDYHSSGGYPLASGRHPSDPDAWVRAARHHCGLPRAVRDAGLGWADADVSPLGCSRGAGDAPYGVSVTWSAPELL